MTTRSLTVVTLLALSMSLVACTSEEPMGEPADSGVAATDATDETAPDALADVTVDATLDADAGADTRADAPVDAPDARIDAKADTTLDAAADTSSDARVDSQTADAKAPDTADGAAVPCDEYASLELAGWATGQASASPVVRATMAPLDWKETSPWLLVMANGAPSSIEGVSATLGQGPNAALPTCTHCVVVELGCTTTLAETTPSAVDCSTKTTLLAVSGTALFTSVPTIAGQTLAGTLTDVTLRQISGDSTIVPGGACIHIGTVTVRGTTRTIADPSARTVSSLFPLLFPNPSAIGGGCSLVDPLPCDGFASTPTCTAAPGTGDGICTTSCGSACTAIGRFCASFGSSDVCLPPCTATGECSVGFACNKVGADAGPPTRACTPPSW